jgi:hypothetical protein
VLLEGIVPSLICRFNFDAAVFGCGKRQYG